MDIRTKLIAWLVVVLGALFGAYRYGRHVEGLERNDKEREGLIAYAQVIKSSGEQHAKDQDTISRLGRELGRVRIHLPTCGENTATDPHGAARVFSAGVDELFADLQARAGEIVQRCDQLNIDARQLNAQVSGVDAPVH